MALLAPNVSGPCARVALLSSMRTRRRELRDVAVVRPAGFGRQRVSPPRRREQVTPPPLPGTHQAKLSRKRRCVPKTQSSGSVGVTALVRRRREVGISRGVGVKAAVRSTPQRPTYQDRRRRRPRVPRCTPRRQAHLTALAAMEGAKEGRDYKTRSIRRNHASTTTPARLRYNAEQAQKAGSRRSRVPQYLV